MRQGLGGGGVAAPNVGKIRNKQPHRYDKKGGKQLILVCVGLRLPPLILYPYVYE